MLLDTHVWIWAAEGDTRRIGPKTRRLLAGTPATATAYVSTASMFEIAALHTAGRLRLGLPVERWIRESIDRVGLRVVDVEASIAVDAGLIPSTALPDPLDRLLVASARDMNMPLVTCDRKILDYARTSRLVKVIDASK